MQPVSARLIQTAPMPAPNRPPDHVRFLCKFRVIGSNRTAPLILLEMDELSGCLVRPILYHMHPVGVGEGIHASTRALGEPLARRALHLLHRRHGPSCRVDL